jgi:ribosomal protein S7
MKKNSNIYDVLLGCITKQGKRTTAKNILNEVFTKVSINTKKPSSYIMKTIIAKLDSIIEVKSVKIRKNTFLVPTPVNSKRRNYLIVKKILQSVKEDSTNRPIAQKISEEIVNIVTQKSSKSLSKKILITKQAVTNRANTHYRW